MSQENLRTEPGEEAGGYGSPTAEQEMGGTDEQRHAGVASNGPGVEPGGPPVPGDADVPSAEAEIDESNADSKGSEPFSSEPEGDAAGLPDGSGNDLSKEKSPNDDDESFDAG